MKTKRLRYAGLFIVLIALALLACNFPGFAEESITETQFTTLEPGLTIVFPTATLSIKETSTPEITPTESIVEGEDGCTLRAAFVDDVTIPDDTVIEKNAEFVKTWRIRNSGTCRWESGTTLVFLSGDQFSDVDSLNVPETEPGDEIEIGINMKAPSESGDHRSNWQLMNAEGKRFGGVFYVKFSVDDTGTPEPVDESWTPPQYFIGKTAVDCQQISFTWTDGTGESGYIVSGTAISVSLAADSTTYVWQNPPTGLSPITLTVKGEDNAILANLNTKVNVNCDSERPNLIIKSMQFDPVKPVANLPLTMTMEIKNTGLVDSGAFITSWYKVTTLSDSTCEWYVNDGLLAGDNVELVCTVEPYSSVNDFVIRGKVDVTQAVVESDEVDNSTDKTITVRAPSVHFDFVDQAPHATWTAGSPDQPLAWPGEDTHTQGYARWITGELENGIVVTDACLQTHPRWSQNGWVKGEYANLLTDGYNVQTGDLFYADVAFLKDAVEGNVTYSVMIQPEGGDAKPIAELPHSYGAGIKSIQADLTSYTGQKVSIILKVEAGANANYDWACWIRAVIYRYP